MTESIWLLTLGEVVMPSDSRPENELRATSRSSQSDARSHGATAVTGAQHPAENTAPLSAGAVVPPARREEPNDQNDQAWKDLQESGGLPEAQEAAAKFDIMERLHHILTRYGIASRSLTDGMAGLPGELLRWAADCCRQSSPALGTPPTVPASPQQELTFSAFSQANRQRCESPQGFNHALGSWDTSDWFLAVLGELGEAANVAKKLNRVRDGIPGNKETPEELRAKLRKECGDAFVYLDLLAQAHGFSISDAAVEVFDAKSQELGYPVALAASSAGSREQELRDAILSRVDAEKRGGWTHKNVVALALAHAEDSDTMDEIQAAGSREPQKETP